MPYVTETLHFRRKAIPPKKLQRKTIPPGTPQGRLFQGRGASSLEDAAPVLDGQPAPQRDFWPSSLFRVISSESHLTGGAQNRISHHILTGQH